MKHTCTLLTYILLLVLCLVLYFLEVGLHVVATWQLYQKEQHIWLSLQIGLLVVPIVSAQFVSIYQSWDTFHWTCARIFWGILHVFQLAMPSRLMRLLFYCGSVDVQKELSQTLQLRTFLIFGSTLPLALLEVYIVFADSLPSDQNKIFIASAIIAIFSASCSLSTFRKRKKDYRFLETIISWPGIVFKFLWKLGELGSRIIVLALFTQLYTSWILMVLVGHWICMLLSLSLETKLKSDSKLTPKSALRILATSYSYVFCYLNIATKPEKYRFVVFYLIMSVENALLLVLWLLYDVRDHLHVPVAAATGVMFVVSLTSAMFYYNCFHIKTNDKLPLSNETNYIQQCINCKLSFCVKHDKSFQRPYNNTDWWVEVRAANSDHDSTDYLYPSEYMINSKALTPGVKSAVLIPVQDLSDEGRGQIRYFKYYQDSTDNGSATSFPSSYLVPYRDPSGDSVSDTYSWDNYDIQNEIQGNSNPSSDTAGVGIEEQPSTDTGTQPRDSNKPSDSGFSASTSSRSGSRLSPFSQGEYVLYISDNDDSDISTSFVSTEHGGGGGGIGRPMRYYLSDQWSITTSTTDTLDHSNRRHRRLLYRLPGGLAKLQETKGYKGRDNQAYAPNQEDGRVVLFPVKVCGNCGSSSTSSPAMERRERPTARKAISERMLAERRRARKQRMANAKMMSRSRQHFKSQMAQIRRKMESSGLSDGDCSVVGVVLSSCQSDLNSSHEKLPITKPKNDDPPKENNTQTHVEKPKHQHHKVQKKKKEGGSKTPDTKRKKKPWEITPENTIQFKDLPKKKPRDLSPAGFEVKFDGSRKKPRTAAADTSIEIENANTTITI